MQPLNDVQKKMVEDYLEQYGERQLAQCIYKICGVRKTKNKVDMKYDDYMDVAYDALGEAAIKYNADKEMKFSVFVEMVAKNRLRTRLRDNKRLMRAHNEFHDSLDRQVEKLHDDSVVELGDIVIDDREERKIETADLSSLRKYLNSLTSLEKDIAIAMLLGASKSQFCEAYDIKMGNLNLILNGMFPKKYKRSRNGRV